VRTATDVYEVYSMADCRRDPDHLYVCETCVRDRPIAAGGASLGRQLAAELRRLLAGRADIEIVQRTVLCLNGCPKPCNIALRGAGKWSLRLGRLTPEDASRIVLLAREYAASPSGEVPPERWPAGLLERVSVRTPPPSRATPWSDGVATRHEPDHRQQPARHIEGSAG
jgi:predicted metal-binding protein